MTDIVPAIIPEDFKYLSEEVSRVKDFVPLVQVDVCDGKFTGNKTWPYRNDAGEFAALREEDTGLPYWDTVDYEFHLMILEPEKTIQDWIQAGASGIIVQTEAVTGESIKTIRDICEAAEVNLGLAVKPSTPLSDFRPYIQYVDFVQYMGSDALGRHGMNLDHSVFEKISALREEYPDMPIAVDIGVNQETAARLISAGATKLVIGSGIFEGNIKGNIEFFQNLQYN